MRRSRMFFFLVLLLALMIGGFTAAGWYLGQEHAEYQRQLSAARADLESIDGDLGAMEREVALMAAARDGAATAAAKGVAETERLERALAEQRARAQELEEALEGALAESLHSEERYLEELAAGVRANLPYLLTPGERTPVRAAVEAQAADARALEAAAALPFPREIIERQIVELEDYIERLESTTERLGRERGAVMGSDSGSRLKTSAADKEKKVRGIDRDLQLNRYRLRGARIQSETLRGYLE